MILPRSLKPLLEQGSVFPILNGNLFPRTLPFLSRLSIILPVYNQADHLASVVESYIEALSRVDIDTEYILVCNGCKDSSESVARELAEKHASVRNEPARKNGWGHAVRHGIKKASGELICYTNLARTSERDLCLLCLYAISNPGTVVKANRKIRSGTFRRLGSLIYNLECRMLFDLSYWDINGTPKVFPREFNALTSLTRDDDLIDLEFNILCRKHEYPVLEVPIFSSSRHGGKSTTTLRTALSLYLGAWRLHGEKT